VDANVRTASRGAAFALLAGPISAALYLLPSLASSAPFLAFPLSVAGLFAATPLLAVRIHGNFVHGLIALSLAFLSILAFDSAASALAFALLFASWAIVAGEVLARTRSVIKGCGAGLVVLAVEALALAALEGGQPIRQALESPQARAPFDQWASQSGLPKQEADAVVERARTAIIALYPALSAVFASFIVALNAVAIGRTVDRLRPEGFRPGELLDLRWPLALVVAFVVSGSLLLMPDFQSTAWNGLVVTLFLFLLQGISVFAFVLSRLFSSELMRVLLVLASLLGPWAIFHSLVGLFDQWFDFRARVTRAGADAGPTP
jgi:uncharacterized protein YybS (DUF2232 family)